MGPVCLNRIMLNKPRSKTSKIRRFLLETNNFETSANAWNYFLKFMRNYNLTSIQTIDCNGTQWSFVYLKSREFSKLLQLVNKALITFWY